MRKRLSMFMKTPHGFFLIGFILSASLEINLLSKFTGGCYMRISSGRQKSCERNLRHFGRSPSTPKDRRLRGSFIISGLEATVCVFFVWHLNTNEVQMKRLPFPLHGEGDVGTMSAKQPQILKYIQLIISFSENLKKYCFSFSVILGRMFLYCYRHIVENITNNFFPTLQILYRF